MESLTLVRRVVDRLYASERSAADSWCALRRALVAQQRFGAVHTRRRFVTADSDHGEAILISLERCFAFSRKLLSVASFLGHVCVCVRGRVSSPNGAILKHLHDAM